MVSRNGKVHYSTGSIFCWLSQCNIMAEGFRFIYVAFRFSEAENLSLSAWVSKVQHGRRCSRARGEDVSFRYVKIKIPDSKLDRGIWMTSCTGSVRVGFWGFEKSQGVSWVFASEEEGWLSELAEALQRVTHVVGDRWKSQHRKIVYFSPYVEKPFNSKVIKSFIPELRSRKVFRVFRIPYVHFTIRLYLAM